jgi:dipeptide transport system permease protein
MLRFILSRLGLLIPTFLGVTVIAFSFIRLVPGDPIELLVGERGLDPERHAYLLREMGFDRPWYVQYFDFLGDVLQGDLGRSIVTKKPVFLEFIELFPATLELSIFALSFAVLIGLPIGILAGVKRGTVFDHTSMTLSLTGFSMPIFWWALLLIIFFSGILKWTPVSGRIDVLYYVEPVTGLMLIDSLLSDEQGAFRSAVSHLILPAVALGTIPMAVIARQTRSAMLEVLNEDYVRTARAKGLPPQGPAAQPRDRPARAQERAHPRGHRDRPADRRAPGGRDPDRDHLRLARHRQVAGRFDQPARLPLGPGRPAADRAPGHDGQPAGRSALRPDQPAHPAREVSAMASVAETKQISRAPPGPLREFWHYFRENKGAVAGLAVVLLLIFLAAFADIVAPHSPFEQYRDALLQPPAWQEGGSLSFLLGTDATGRDILSRIIHGSRLSLLIGCIAVTLSLSVGIALGLLAAFFRTAADALIMRLMDVILAVPSLLLALVIVAILGPGLVNAMIAVAVVYVPHYVRLARASAMGELSKDYVTASRVSGAGLFRLMLITVLPNCMPPLIVQATLGFSSAVLDAAALGFLGVGAQPPTPEWGAMLADAREFILRAWWVVTFPGLAILITVLAFNLMGDGLRDALDPKLKRS